MSTSSALRRRRARTFSRKRIVAQSSRWLSSVVTRAAGREELEVAEQHRRLPNGKPSFAHTGRVVEHELDMNRSVGHAYPLRARIERLMRWLMPDGQLARKPARSIARELEEAFPSRDN